MLTVKFLNCLILPIICKKSVIAEIIMDVLLVSSTP